MTHRLGRCNLEAGSTDAVAGNNVYQTAIIGKHLDRTEDQLFHANIEMLPESAALTVIGQSSAGIVGHTN